MNCGLVPQCEGDCVQRSFHAEFVFWSLWLACFVFSVFTRSGHHVSCCPNPQFRARAVCFFSEVIVRPSEQNCCRQHCRLHVVGHTWRASCAVFLRAHVTKSNIFGRICARCSARSMLRSSLILLCATFFRPIRSCASWRGSHFSERFGCALF